MANKKRKKRIEDKTGGRVRLLFLLAAVLSGVPLLVLRCELIAGIRTYLLGSGRQVIETAADLPSQPSACAVFAEAVGIPDYGNVFRLERRAGAGGVACFRIVGFENRLVVCSPKGLNQPRDIEEIILKKRFSGSLDRLDRCPLNDSVRRAFRGKVGETLLRDAFLLEVGRNVAPSIPRSALFVFLAVVCFFSSYRAIKG